MLKAYLNIANLKIAKNGIILSVFFHFILIIFITKVNVSIPSLKSTSLNEILAI